MSFAFIHIYAHVHQKHGGLLFGMPYMYIHMPMIRHATNALSVNVHPENTHTYTANTVAHDLSFSTSSFCECTLISTHTYTYIKNAGAYDSPCLPADAPRAAAEGCAHVGLHVSIYIICVYEHLYVNYIHIYT